MNSFHFVSIILFAKVFENESCSTKGLGKYKHQFNFMVELVFLDCIPISIIYYDSLHLIYSPMFGGNNRKNLHSNWKSLWRSMVL